MDPWIPTDAQLRLMGMAMSSRDRCHMATGSRPTLLAISRKCAVLTGWSVHTQVYGMKVVVDKGLYGEACYCSAVEK